MTLKTLERIKVGKNPSVVHALKGYHKAKTAALTSATHSQLSITAGGGGGGTASHTRIIEDPEEQLLKITEIVLTEVKDEDNGEVEINDEGEEVKKGPQDKKKTVGASAKPRMSMVSGGGNSVSNGNFAEEPERDDVDLNNSDAAINDKKDRFRRNKQFNDKYELDKFILYLIFAKKTNRGMRNQAVKVLVRNFN